MDWEYLNRKEEVKCVKGCRLRVVQLGSCTHSYASTMLKATQRMISVALMYATVYLRLVQNLRV